MRTREIAEGIRLPYERVQLVDSDFCVSRNCHNLLRENIQRILGDLRLLDLAVAHRARDDRALEQVGAELREDASL